MKTTEFRIGNRILFDGKEFSISSLHGDGTFRLKTDQGSIGCYPAKAITPIEITEELLIGFGFEKKPAHSWNGNGHDYTIGAKDGGSTTEQVDYVLSADEESNDFIFRFESFETNGTKDSYTSIHIGEWYANCYHRVNCVTVKYVHQLQNLYFALTGKELECR